MMNSSAASITRRPASGSTATAGCCPMLVHPQFYMNTFSTQAPPPLPPPPPPAPQQCLLGSQQTTTTQLQLSNTTTTQQSTPQQQPPNQALSNALPVNLSGLATNLANNLNSTTGHQQQSQQLNQASRQQQQDLHSNYNTSLSAHTLPLQHLLANRHPQIAASNCMAIAAALASASFHQHQQLQQTLQQQQQQHHQQTLINLPQQQSTTTNVDATNNALSSQQTSTISSTTTATTTITNDNNATTNNINQVPILPNFNSYNAAHFQAILINQLFANHQFAPPPVAPQQAPAAPITSARPTHVPMPSTGPLTAPPQPPSSTQQPSIGVVSQPQQTTLQPQQEPQTIDQPSQLQPQGPTFQPVAQTTAQTRLTQVPPPILDSYQNPQNSLYQQTQQNAGQVDSQQINQPQEPVPLQTQQQQPRPPSQQQAQPTLQQSQPIPPIPFYAFPQMEQALAILTNPQVASNLFNQVFNIYLQSGLRSEAHHTHHHHHPPHHYHHHLHGSHHHHHHHHGPNGQNNGQDDTMLTISESKPRGLNRAEIDSLTPYIQSNEKDSRTCVICLSRFELKSKIRPLPCNHAFHAKCVDKWLRANRTCPICRRDALKTYGAKIKRI